MDTKEAVELEVLLVLPVNKDPEEMLVRMGQQVPLEGMEHQEQKETKDHLATKVKLATKEKLGKLDKKDNVVFQESTDLQESPDLKEIKDLRVHPAQMDHKVFEEIQDQMVYLENQ